MVKHSKNRNAPIGSKVPMLVDEREIAAVVKEEHFEDARDGVPNLYCCAREY